MLTKKERRVLELRKNGLKQREIASKIKISQPAVSLFEKSISRKIRSSIKTLELIKELGINISKLKKRLVDE